MSVSLFLSFTGWAAIALLLAFSLDNRAKVIKARVDYHPLKKKKN